MENKQFEESGYLFDFTDSILSQKADEPQFHDLSAVDFIVEMADNFLFVEIKNPDNQKATAKAKREFLNDLKNDMYPYKIGSKYSNTILRSWGRGESFSKPIICIFILEFTNFTAIERKRLRDKIFNRLPFSLNKLAPDGRKHLHSFELLTIDEFRNKFCNFYITNA
ncbi:MAG: hypothetical protein LBB56_01300 [Chitinispirillales bacterium]|jgi:hypothetical protein|nr:hypothetical protein [Chitinispirillales bacterium]